MAEEKVIEFGDITVTSTTIDDRFQAKRAEPSNIAAVSGEEVDNAHLDNIQQVLQSIPGITTEFDSRESLKVHYVASRTRYTWEKNRAWPWCSTECRMNL